MELTVEVNARVNKTRMNSLSFAQTSLTLLPYKGQHIVAGGKGNPTATGLRAIVVTNDSAVPGILRTQPIVSSAPKNLIETIRILGCGRHHH